MFPWILIATATAFLSAGALYAGSRHCRWPSWRRLGRAGTWAGLLLAALSLALWIGVAGAGVGLCAMLGSWMLALMVLPYLAGLRISMAGNGEDAR